MHRFEGELALQHCCSNPDRRYSGSCEAAVLGRAIFDGIMSETVVLYLLDFKFFKQIRVVSA